MSTGVAGKGGSVMWNGTAEDFGGEIDSWSLDITVDTIDSTSMGDTWRTALAGFYDWTATVETKWTSDDTDFISLIGATATLELQLVDGGATIEGTAICTNQSISADKEDVIKITYNFKGSGELSYNATGS